MSTCHALDGPHRRRGPGRRHDGTRRIARLPSSRKFRLRYKLEADPKNPALIRTVRNGGYIFLPKVTRG